MRWLLDTNMWITFLKPGGRTVAERLEQCDEGDVALCSVVKAELWHGGWRVAGVESSSPQRNRTNPTTEGSKIRSHGPVAF